MRRLGRTGLVRRLPKDPSQVPFRSGLAFFFLDDHFNLLGLY